MGESITELQTMIVGNFSDFLESVTVSENWLAIFLQHLMIAYFTIHEAFM